MKNKIIKITALVMVVMIMAAFTDVPKDHWAYDTINLARSKGLVKGVSETEDIFEPGRTISAQEVALLLQRTNQRYAPKEVNTEELVSNHAIDLVASDIAEWAYAGISYGFENHFWTTEDFTATKGGTGDATRELISKWVMNISPKLKSYSLRVFRYDDSASIDPAYYSCVDTMYKYGIMRGSDDNCFYPKRSITRAEAAAVAIRAEDASTNVITAVDKEPFVYELDYVSNVDLKYKTFMLGNILISIDDNAGILLNGSAATFDEIKNLEGKKISVSQCISGTNTSNFVIQSKPQLCGGTVEKVQTINNKKIGINPYQIITINVGGLSIDYVKDTETDVLKTISVGNEVQFISDGIYLLEIM